MKNQLLKRGSMIALSLMLVTAFSFVTTPTASAKEKTKSFQVMTSMNEKWQQTTVYDGQQNQSRDTYSIKYAYNKQGLRTGASNNKIKATYKHNKKGFLTQAIEKNKSGKMLSKTVFTLKKNGDPSKEVYYSETTGFKKPSRTTTYTYHKKGVVKKSVSKTDLSQTTTTYDKYGNITKEIYSSTFEDGTTTTTTTYTNTLDKKHNPKKVVSTSVIVSPYGKSTSSSTKTTKFTYKKGKMTKSVSSITLVGTDGTTSTQTQVITLSYNKQGNVTKRTTADKTFMANGDSQEFKDSVTYKYKTVKVPKKYWHLFK